MSKGEFSLAKLAIGQRRLLWAPDGDEAFDDRSHVLQFDVGDRVRLVGFTQLGERDYSQGTLRDVWMLGDDYYGILDRWHKTFEREWSSENKGL